MRIALFSDVHANLPALEACLKNIEENNPDAVYCLGDLVGYNIWPNEVIHEIRRRRIPVIAGNYDFGIGQMSDDCGCSYKTEREKEMGKVSIAYTNEVIDAESRRYLRSLPAHIRLEFRCGNDHISLLLVHGSPRKVNEYLFEDREEKSFIRIMDDAKADILCFGHTHKPFHRVFYDHHQGKPRQRHAINTGSVGKPKDGNPDGGYVILHIDPAIPFPGKEALKVEFVRFTYDIEKAARAIEAGPLPDEYAEMLRKAY